MKKSYWRIIGRVPSKYRELVVAICYTESNLNYGVKHPDKDTIGIAGIKAKLHKDVLDGVNPNSLYACYLVLKKYKFSVKKYKGSIRNFKTVERVKVVIKENYKRRIKWKRKSWESN